MKTLKVGLMTRTLADEIRELQDRLVAIAEGKIEEMSGNHPDLVTSKDTRQNYLHQASVHISKAMEFHMRDAEFGDEYLNHVEEAMDKLRAILEQHHRI